MNLKLVQNTNTGKVHLFQPNHRKSLCDDFDRTRENSENWKHGFLSDREIITRINNDRLSLNDLCILCVVEILKE